MTFPRLPFVLAVAAALPSSALAQNRPAPVVSPEVHPDRTVTFRLRAPQANEVKLWGEWGTGAALTKDESGVWSATVGPVAPDLYGYSFTVDGVGMVDPANRWVKPMRSSTTSVLDVPGVKPSPCDRVEGVPQGTVHLHDYASAATGTRRRLRVYTPPGYGADGPARFPVLYLLHGSGDNEATWTELGQAHIILDNLLAAGKVVPMVVVMTDGHAVVPGDADARASNLTKYEGDLLGSVMPLVETEYRVLTDPGHRGIVGLSMGGQQSLTVGLNHPELFAWVGGMSSAVREPEKVMAPFLAAADKANDQFRQVWFACGKDDFLLKENQAFDELLTARGVKHTFALTEGNHSWPVWRRYLTEFAPAVFR